MPENLQRSSLFPAGLTDTLPQVQHLFHELHDGFPARTLDKNIPWRLEDEFFPPGVRLYFHEGFLFIVDTKKPAQWRAAIGFRFG